MREIWRVVTLALAFALAQTGFGQGYTISTVAVPGGNSCTISATAITLATGNARQLNVDDIILITVGFEVWARS